MQDRVRGPAIGLIVVGVLGITAFLTHLALDEMVTAVFRLFDASDADIDSAVRALHPFGWWFEIAQILIGVAASSFVVYGGLQMMSLRRRTLVTVASVLAMVPFFTSWCCCVGIPVGIWALVVLSKPEVKDAFTS